MQNVSILELQGWAKYYEYQHKRQKEARNASRGKRRL
tara:strand:+ start:552 stop:662 length:111 start_codon:yes stop_codon:yes gene_type:complete